MSVIPTIAPFLLPRMLPRLRRERPQLKLFLREETSDAALELLHHGRADCVLLALPFPTGEVDKETIATDSLYVAFPYGEPRNPPAEASRQSGRNSAPIKGRWPRSSPRRPRPSTPNWRSSCPPNAKGGCRRPARGHSPRSTSASVVRLDGVGGPLGRRLVQRVPSEPARHRDRPHQTGPRRAVLTCDQCGRILVP